MPSNELERMDAEQQNAAPARQPLTAREKRRRILLLTLLVLLLVGLLGAAWSFNQNRSISMPALQRDAGEVVPPRYLYSITGTGANRLDRPIGVGVGPNGRVYVVDFTKRRISVFDTRGRFLFAFNKVGSGTLKNPVHLAIHNGEVWVTDRRLRNIYIFGLDGSYKRRFEPKNDAKLNWSPLALAFDGEGRLRTTDVGDTTKHRLLYFTEEGSRTATIGKTQQVNKLEAGPGAFYFPNGLAVAKNGDVYVADGDNRRVQVFNKDGKFLRFLDTSGVPRGLVIDAKNRLYVVDALAHTVDVYTLQGKALTHFGTRGFGPGEFNFPNDVAIDAQGRLYVSDRDNNQVQVWGWPGVVVPATVVPNEPWQWSLCLLPLLLLPLLFLLRKRRYVLTPAFVETLVAAERTDVLAKRRLKFVAPEFDEAWYQELSRKDILDYVVFEPYSAPDAAATMERLRCSEEQAAYAVMADRARALLTEDLELQRIGIASRIRVLDLQQFLADVGEKR